MGRYVGKKYREMEQISTDESTKWVFAWGSDSRIAPWEGFVRHDRYVGFDGGDFTARAYVEAVTEGLGGAGVLVVPGGLSLRERLDWINGVRGPKVLIVLTVGYYKP